MGALSALLLLLAGSLAARTTSPASGQKKASAHSSSQSSKSAKSKSHRASKKKQASSRRNGRRRGQLAIQQDRAREIQAALIREHYLTGKPTGVWDERTKKAMAQYQEDHGWQTRKLPDARALIQLGLGPTHEGLLNPESVASTERPSAAPPANPAIGAPR
ncbi:MAG: peptidoglycan-binding domain-containing protein [Terriglobales bacterium]